MPLSLPTMGVNPNFQEVADWLAAAASALVSEGNSALQSLQQLADVDFGSVGTTPLYNATQWAVFASGIGTAPTAPTLTTVPLDTLIQQIQLLTPPNTPTVSFSYNEPGFVGQLRPTVADKLLFDLLNGGYGIDVNDEQALFDRSRDRENQLMSENEMNVVARQAGTGFPLPQGALYKQMDKARSDYVAKVSGVNREITLERSRLFVENRRRVIEQAIQYEGQGIELYNAIQNRTLLAARTEVEMAVFLFDSGVRLFTSRLAALTAAATTQLGINQALVGIHTAEVNAYAATANALIQAARVDMQNSKNASEHALNVWQSQVQVTRDEIEQLVATTNNRRDIAKYLTDFFRTGLGSAMNGINGLAVQNSEVEAT